MIRPDRVLRFKEIAIRRGRVVLKGMTVIPPTAMRLQNPSCDPSRIGSIARQPLSVGIATLSPRLPSVIPFGINPPTARRSQDTAIIRQPPTARRSKRVAGGLSGANTPGTATPANRERPRERSQSPNCDPSRIGSIARQPLSVGIATLGPRLPSVIPFGINPPDHDVVQDGSRGFERKRTPPEPRSPTHAFDRESGRRQMHLRSLQDRTIVVQPSSVGIAALGPRLPSVIPFGINPPDHDVVQDRSRGFERKRTPPEPRSPTHAFDRESGRRQMHLRSLQDRTIVVQPSSVGIATLGPRLPSVIPFGINPPDHVVVQDRSRGFERKRTPPEPRSPTHAFDRESGRRQMHLRSLQDRTIVVQPLSVGIATLGPRLPSMIPFGINPSRIAPIVVQPLSVGIATLGPRLPSVIPFGINPNPPTAMRSQRTMIIPHPPTAP
ncbi:hypothetical protein Poly41_70820 [Novipirellula artificiosorum]|uniref:Uncharacterized protein n=1 Tax=Novipirellula artificiosorum TaxID=2528016 RepID=A0A5C6CMU9_9BACT|nr:hypothetical protein Poly41_70820 [Novipirellula artificiosorum]